MEIGSEAGLLQKCNLIRYLNGLPYCKRVLASLWTQQLVAAAPTQSDAYQPSKHTSGTKSYHMTGQMRAAEGQHISAHNEARNGLEACLALDQGMVCQDSVTMMQPLNTV